MMKAWEVRSRIGRGCWIVAIWIGSDSEGGLKPAQITIQFLEDRLKPSNGFNDEYIV